LINVFFLFLAEFGQFGIEDFLQWHLFGFAIILFGFFLSLLAQKIGDLFLGFQELQYPLVVVQSRLFFKRV